MVVVFPRSDNNSCDNNNNNNNNRAIVVVVVVVVVCQAVTRKVRSSKAFTWTASLACALASWTCAAVAAAAAAAVARAARRSCFSSTSLVLDVG